MRSDTDVVYLSEIIGDARPESMSLLRLSELLAEGLPLTSLDRVGALVAPDDRHFVHLIVSEPTLKRRRRRGQALGPRESERLERVARVWRLAKNVYGSDTGARRVVNQPHPMLDDRTPLSVAIANDVGARTVEGILGRLKHGSAA